MKILLGSNSPRRFELLSSLGYVFEKVAINCEEDFVGIKPKDVAVYLAKKKSDAFDNLLENEVLITADTIVLVGNKVLNKPKNKQEATEMLMEISGKKHKVVTAVCLRSISKCILLNEKTEVSFSNISASEIAYYVDTFAPLDKAGSYGIQEWIGLSKVTEIQGCFYNVMGLPTAALYGALSKEFNLFPTNMSA